MLELALDQLRQRYPSARVLADLLDSRGDQFIVRGEVWLDTHCLASGLAADTSLETAEDRALLRALRHLGIPETESSMTYPTGQLQEVPKPLSATTMPTSSVLPAQSATATNMEAESAQLREATALEQTPPTRPTASVSREPVRLAESIPLSHERPKAPPEVPNPKPFHPPSSNGIPPQSEEMPSFTEQPVTEQPVTEQPGVTARSGANRPFTPPGALPTSSQPPQVIPGVASAEPIDLSDIIAQTDVELQRLGWTVTQGREFLEHNYQKRSRHDLSDEELLQFLLYLESQPTP